MPNWSNLSNVPNVTTSAPVDVVAPAAVAINVVSVTASTASLTWAAPGDDGSVGTAAEYDIRYSTSVITEGNWVSATQVTGEPAPHVAGTAESHTVTGLVASTTYYFAMKTRDEVPNWSNLSNVPNVTTSTPVDVVAPAATVLKVYSVTVNTADMTWTAPLWWWAPGDDGSVGTATEYDVRYSPSVITAASWASATQMTGEPTPQVAGNLESYTVHGPVESGMSYFAMKTRDEVGNWSNLSNVVAVGAPTVGIYFDAAGTVSSRAYSVYSPLTAYIVMKNCTSLEGVSGWECRVSAPANVTYLSQYVGSDAINISTYPEFTVGVATPIPNSSAMVLGAIDYLTTSSATGYFDLGPTSVPDLPNSMVWTAGPSNEIRPMYVNSTPSARINP